MASQAAWASASSRMSSSDPAWESIGTRVSRIADSYTAAHQIQQLPFEWLFANGVH